MGRFKMREWRLVRDCASASRRILLRSACLLLAMVSVLLLQSASTWAIDGLQYIASYDDLIRAFGPNSAAGVWHHTTHGQAEGRRIDNFDEITYLNKYPDLRAAFGRDTQAATIHYITYGYFEGRTDKRNILLIIADDMGVDVAEFYPVAAGRRPTQPAAPSIPNLVGLARQGPRSSPVVMDFGPE